MSLTTAIFALVAAPFLAIAIVLLFYKFFLRLGYNVQRQEFQLELEKKDEVLQELSAQLRKKEADFSAREARFFLREAEFIMKESAFVEKEKEFERTYTAMEKVINIQEKTIQQIRRRIDGDEEDLTKLFGR